MGRRKEGKGGVVEIKVKIVVCAPASLSLKCLSRGEGSDSEMGLCLRSEAEIVGGEVR
jgi:hypothetical protein